MTTNSRDFGSSKGGGDDCAVDGGGGGGGDNRGAGGKILRGRRTFRSEASPYTLSKEPSPTPPSPQAETRGWFSRFISGSRRFLSSAFFNESDSCSSSSYDSDSEIEEKDHDPADEFASDTNSIAIDRLDPKPNLIESAEAEPQICDSPSKTKMSIEKILQQETYSRDESKKLMEIIMSRVVEPPTQEETNKEEIIADYLPSTRPTRPSYLNTFHPNSSVDLVHTPHTSSAAIVEAKKWVEEKRLRSNIDLHPSCGPTLNTDFFSRESNGARGSPIDLAQSYMHALPPWRSPINDSIGFTTPSSAKISHIDASESADAMDSNQIECQRKDISSSPVLRRHSSTIKANMNEHPAANVPLPSEPNFHNASSDHDINVTSVNEVVSKEEQGGNNTAVHNKSSVGDMTLLEQHKASDLLGDELHVEPEAMLSENITNTGCIDGSEQIQKTTNLIATSGISNHHQLGSSPIFEGRDNKNICSNNNLHSNAPLDENQKTSLPKVGGYLDNHQPETMRSIKQMLRELPPDNNGHVKKTVARGRRGKGRGRGRGRVAK